MAEFKLGRIRFVWKDVWITGTTYYVDDVVRNGGKTYICTVGHTAAADFYTNLDYNPTKWNQMTDGQEWKSDWTVGTFYKDNDVVKYGALLYICTNSHTSAATLALGLEANLPDNWDVFAEGTEWKNTWTISTRYKIGDLVRTGAYTYVCKTGHTSAATELLGLEANAANWDEFNAGLEYKGAWSGSSVLYKLNDIVKQGAGLWICIDKHISTTNFITDSSAYWSQFVEGVQFEDNWNSSTVYQIGDIVRYGGNQYIAITNHFNATPSTSTAIWSLFSEGITFESEWSSATAYRVGNVISQRGYTYIATADSTNQEPPNLTYWQKLNSGISWQAEWVDDVIYKLGDAVRYGSNAYICVLGHKSEADDGSTIGNDPQGGGNVNSRPDQDISGTYWNLLSIGTEVSVLTTRGDLVYFGGAGPTRLPIGTEGQVLRAGADDPEWVSLGAADQVYYVAPHGSDAPSPVQGKTLDKPFKTIRYACEQVENGPRNPSAQRLLELNRVFIQREVTSWIDYQVANATSDSIWENFVYEDAKCARDIGFVVDRLQWDIGHGGNLKIRAAAQSLLGLLVDGPFSVAEEDAPYSTLSSETAQGIAAYNYLLVVVAAVLANQAPAVAYQNVTDDSTAIAGQFIDITLVAEAGVLTTITLLVAIITDALANPTQVGPLPTIPARYVPFTLINVATGQYRETLPIIVPANTCIQGDELRSTNVGPAGSLVDISDSYYSLSSLAHISGFIGNIVTGSTVTPTTGNIVAQSANWPFADVAENVAVTQLVDVIKLQSDYRLGTLHTTNLIDPVGYNAGYLAGYGNARKLIKENKKFLQEEVITYLKNSYSSLAFTGSIAGNVLTVTSVESGVVTNDALIHGESVIQGTRIDKQLSGATGEIGTYEVSKFQTVPSTIIKADTKYSRTANRRDTGYAIDAVIYDLTYGGNSQSVTAGLAYFDGDSADSTIAKSILSASFKPATLAGLAFLKTRMQAVALGSAFTPLQTVITPYTDTVGSAESSTLIGNSLDAIIEIIDTGPGAVGSTVTLSDPATTDGVSSTTALIGAYSALNSAAATIRANTISYINAQYPALTYDSAKCSRDIGIILKAVGYDFMLGNVAANNVSTNFKSIIAAQSYLRDNAAEVYTLGQKAVTIEAIEYARTQAIANVSSDATAIARINILMPLITTIIYSGSNEGNVCSTELRNRDYAILQLELNRSFIVAEVNAYIANTFSDTATAVTTNVITISDTSWLKRNAEIVFSGTTFGGITVGTRYYVQSVVSSTTFTVSTTRYGTAALFTDDTGSMAVNLAYNTESCARDVGTYIDALKWDLKYTSNYQSRFASRYYANAVLGSLEEDMYYLRDGTGLRDQTLVGLTGDMLAENEFGTSRVSAGAYASLDPGWGPNDFRTWIISRSPYVQGLTTFGNGAVGQKIDGALHNGGNDSIVSNDFTQVISDGIGAWITNNGRAELVSVFSYYAHIAYLAENGGRIRATNGNNSYGDFGSVAEGFDDRETPNTAVVDNILQFVATVGNVTTTGAQFIGLEFSNAGIDYTDAQFVLTGGGINATSEADEFRDDAVYQVRLVQLAEDGLNGEFGGSGYLTNSNTAQAGSTTQITLAATDSTISTGYIGMKVVITGGTGVGQFGIIDTYNTGTKIATIITESTGAAGWEHFVAGTTIASPDASTTYTVEPRLTFTAPSYASAAGTGLPTAGTYTDVKFASAVTTYLGVAGTGGTGTGATFNVIKKGTKYLVSIAAAGTGYVRLNTLTIAGTSLGGVSTTNDITITITAINSLSGAVLAVDTTGSGVGGNFVALLSGSATAETSIGGTWTSRTLSASRDWIAAASGQDITAITADSLVAGTAYKITVLGDSLFNTVGAVNNFVGTTFIATGATTGTGTVVAVNSIIVAIATGSNTTTRSVDGGINWTDGGNLPATTTWTSIAYGGGVWVAVATGGTANAYSTNGGLTWVAGAVLPASTTWTSVTYGAGKFVAVASGGTQAAYSINYGLTWVTAALPSSTNWKSVEFGNNRFVAVSSTSGTAAAFSLDGITWVASTIISAAYLSVAYGQGTFVAVGAGTTAASSPDGVVWTSRTISTSNSVAVVFGNTNRIGKFVTISNSGASNVSVITASTRARARAQVANGKIFAINILEPGSGYASLPTMTITDPNNIFEAPFTVRTGKGTLANPSFINRGIQYETASAEIGSGDGFADNYQTGSFVAVRQLATRPVAGSNVVFDGVPGVTFKLVNIVTFLGTNDGEYTAFLQISPQLTISQAPEHLEGVTTRLRYSQVRLTGHDFLDIGTGSFTESNYPNDPLQDPIPGNETVEADGGRVFFTSTDQDGNFRVGSLFAIEQSTGIATLNADAFNISGLQELNLGNVTLGGGSATITEFSTDPFFTADSDNIVPTQRAIKAFIASQIGGGGASLNVNSVTAGAIFISSNVITTVTGTPIKMNATFEFRGGVIGLPLAFNYFLN